MTVKRRSHSLLWQLALVLFVGIGLFRPLASAAARLLPSPAVASVLTIGLVAGSMAGVIYWLFIRRIRQINDVLEEVVAGDLERELPSRPGGEIGVLVDNVGRMVGTLRSNYEDLKKNDDLRRRLIANVSHELRTPLTSIQGYLETSRRPGTGAADLERNLEICHRETAKLGRLVQDLFELSKLDTQQLEFHYETVSLVEIADQVGLAFEQRMADKEIHFETRFCDDPLEVRGDGNRLGQVIQNLLGNASVFTPPHGSVALICERVGGKARMRVVDTGVGIPEQDLPHIFESFFHLEKSRTRNLGGTGLGLSICKAIVEAHQGEITVESQISEGTTFIIDLDLVTDPTG